MFYLNLITFMIRKHVILVNWDIKNQQKNNVITIKMVKHCWGKTGISDAETEGL